MSKSTQETPIFCITEATTSLPTCTAGRHHMTITLRPGTAADAAACGPICYEAFKAVGEAHNFPPDFRSAESATELMSMLLTHPRFYSVVAELDGRVVGSNFLDEGGPIAGVGPITV